MVNDLFPYGTTVDRVLISGTGLLKIFYASVGTQKQNEKPKINAEDRRIHFQVSGIKVEFDNKCNFSSSVKTVEFLIIITRPSSVIQGNVRVQSEPRLISFELKVRKIVRLSFKAMTCQYFCRTLLIS